MLQQLLAAAMQRKQEQDLVMRAIGAIVTRQGGVVELQLDEMTEMEGGLSIEVDGDRKTVILKAVTGEELAALEESVGEEKH